MSVSHEPTIEIRAKVNALSSFGIRQEQIAKYIGISVPTLTKYYREELETAKIDKIIQVANALFNNAVENNNVTAQVFFLKTQANWRETDRNEEKNDKGDIGKIQIEVIGAKDAKTVD